MRLFVAVAPPASALGELAAALEPVRAAAPGDLRWTRAEQWHLTLAFLGDVPEGDAPAVAEALSTACRVDPFDLRLAGGGAFGDRVLWVGVAGDVRALRTLAESVAAAARGAGVDLPDSPYRPHLTVARAARAAPGAMTSGRPAAALRPAAEALAPFMGTPWRAGSVHLVRSTLGAGPGRGAAHEPVATWALEAHR